MRRRTQAERTRATTGGLIETALRLFGTHGYAATSIEDIARESGLTKGAVYHHFTGKAELFRAAFVRQEERLADVIAEAAAGGAEPMESVRLGVLALLRACGEPEVRRIVLLDGPAVLGWEGVREIEYAHTLRLLHAGLALAAAQGAIAPGDVTVRAHLIFGAVCEGGMLIARAPDPDATLTAVLIQAERLLDALSTDKPPAPDRGDA
jgi:AcrR family transcriptional regulator